MKTSQGEINDQPCTQLSIPDNTQEDCAFEGAMLALVPITDAAHLVHGPSGCIGNFWGSNSSLDSDDKLYKVRFTTDMDESDIIFGGAKKLYRAILELERRYKPKAVFVYSTCVSAMIGDDINGACLDASEQTKIPIIPVDSPGFVGEKNQGTRLAGEAMLAYVVGTAEPDFTTPYDINLIGEYNIAGAVWNILPLLEKLGIRVLAKITGGVRYKEVCYAHRAKLNVVTDSKPLLKMAKNMEKRFGIPYIQESFYGVEDINRGLRNISALFGDSNLQERTEKLIAEETTILEEKLALYSTDLYGKCIVIYVESGNSWSIISAAHNIGMSVIALLTHKSSQSDRSRIKTLLGKDGIIIEQEIPTEIQRIINENQADMLIADNCYQYIALKAKIAFLNINQEFDHSNTAYAEILAVLHQLYVTLYNPIWEQVRKPIPWNVEV